MNISKSRIIEIIKEEICHLSETEQVELGIEPVDIDPMQKLKHEYQDEKGVAMEHITDEQLLKFAVEKLFALRRGAP